MAKKTRFGGGSTSFDPVKLEKQLQRRKRRGKKGKPRGGAGGGS